MGSESFATGYSYDSSGRLSGLTYPSGRTVAYGFDALGRIQGITTTQGSAQTVLSNAAYHPFGGVSGFTFGNGQTYTRSFDLDGRIASYSLGAQSFTVGYDPASRITSISEVGNPPNTNTYGYDLLDRLTGATLPTTPYGFTYDGVGNRLTKTVAAATDTYAPAAASNRLASITPATGPVRTYTHDANGAITADGINTYTYDTRGRLMQAVSVIGTSTYQLNAVGQRIRKTNSQGDTVYHYDSGGRLIAESSTAGAVQREYVYLGEQPVAVLDAAGTLYFIHSDHLNTPRVITNSTGQTVWRWDHAEPFGSNPPNENPSGLGIFTCNLRLPGQYFDKETNLHYNYFRDYDPSIGRYVQSDPIGLEGGINTYTYAYDDPLRFTDPRGEAVPLIVAGAVIGAVANTGIYLATTRQITWQGALGSVLGGAAAGAIGTVSTPISAFLGLGTRFGGTAVVNAAAGVIGNTISAGLDPCQNVTPQYLASSAFYSAVGGAAAQKYFPTQGMQVFGQVGFPRTWSGVIPIVLGGNAGPNANAVIQGGVVSGAFGLGPNYVQ